MSAIGRAALIASSASIGSHPRSSRMRYAIDGPRLIPMWQCTSRTASGSRSASAAKAESVIEPDIGLWRPVIVRADPAVHEIGCVLRDKTLVAPLGSCVEDVGDPGLSPLLELVRSPLGILVQVAADHDPIRDWAQTMVPVGDVEVVSHRWGHCAASGEVSWS